MQIKRIKNFILGHIVLGVTTFMLLSLFATTYFTYQWWQARQQNIAFSTRSLVKQAVNPENHLSAYSIGYLQAEDNKLQIAARAFTYAEASNDPEIRALAKFALGNIYFSLAMKSSNIAAGGAHQQAVAQIELAREAFKGALRLKPDLYDARYNLELLDRLSPDRRTQAWKAETDGVTLQPFKRNGTAMMRDNTRRGLP